ncbi:MAG: hypothetical protein LGB54_02400, partial [Sulfurovum sp.]|nr:hypothetical protein [Sulfurovum sp.]
MINLLPGEADLRRNDSSLTSTRAPETMSMTEAACASGLTETRISTSDKKEAQKFQGTTPKYVGSIQKNQPQQQQLQLQKEANRPTSQYGSQKAVKSLADKDTTLQNRDTAARSTSRVAVPEIKCIDDDTQQQQWTRQQVSEEQPAFVGRQGNARPTNKNDASTTSGTTFTMSASGAVISQFKVICVDDETQQVRDGHTHT